MQPRLLILALGLAVVAASWFAFQSVAAWRLRSELRMAARDFAARRISDAKARLTQMAKRWTGRGEVEYWLGVCELAEGHPDAAMAAWERVPDDAAEAPRAALSRGRVAIETGRYGLAESVLDRVKQAPGEVGNEARRLLGWVSWMTGRYDEYRRLLHREADGQVDPTQTLRSLWSLDNDPYPLESMTLALDRAGRLAPEDDRVWLAKADLGTRSGRFDEADSWLQRCEQARPDDPVVWNARLEWAKAAGRPDDVARAAAHLPAARFSRSQVLRMTSWLAGPKGDRKAEKTALTQTYCDPRYFPALPDHVFRNDRGQFVDVTDQAGVIDPGGRGLGVLATDLDGDGKTDLLVTNDTTANYVFRNLGGLRYVEKGMEFALATSASGAYLAGMGIACGDFDSDGRIDIAVTNLYGESTTLYHNHGDGLFSDRTAAAGLSATTRVVLGFGLVALDANNDGKLDLAQSNGHVGDLRPSIPYAMPAQLLLGDGAGKLSDVSARAGPPWTVPRLGRGVTAGDFDNDGRIDLLMVVENDPVVFCDNQTPSPGHFLTLSLEGTSSNRDAVGARVAVTCAGQTRVAA